MIRPAAVLVLLLAPAAAHAQAPTLEACEEQLKSRPEAPWTYYCFVLAARGHGANEQAARRLEEIWRADPDNHRALLNLALLEQDSGNDAALPHYREAAQAAEEAGDAWGAVYARTGLATELSRRGDPRAAEEELSRAQETADRSGDPVMLAHVLAVRGAAAQDGGDTGLALRLFRRAERIVFPDGPDYVKSWVLSGLGAISLQIGDPAEALAIYEREADLHRASGDLLSLATPLVNRALAGQALFLAGRIDLAPYREMAVEAVDAAVESGNRVEESGARVQLGLVLEGEEALEQFERAREIARDLRDAVGEGLALRIASRENLVLGDPERLLEARRLAGEALDLARRAGDETGRLGAMISLADIARVDGSRVEAIERSLEVIETLEERRSRYREAGLRARASADAANSYEDLASWLIDTRGRSPDPDADLGLAFGVLERMRARELIESMDGGAGAPPPGDPAEAERLAEIHKQIAKIQRILLATDLEEAARLAEEDALRALEDEAFELLDAAAGAARTRRGTPTRIVATLQSVREALAPDQAMLYFAFGTHRERFLQVPGHGCWVIGITRSSIRAFSLPDEADLSLRLDMYRGLIEAGDESSERAGARLYGELLAGVLAWLPEGIARLVIVPEAALYGVPLGALREDAASEPVAGRFELAMAPSATLWTRWRSSGPISRGSVLSIADPAPAAGQAFPGGEEDGGTMRGRALPHMREALGEARRMVGEAGSGLVVSGEQANERFVKTADLRGYTLIHLAAHALIDTYRVERSAILLSPGAPDEDGLLQVREIAGLDLEGKVVILSACSSATGEALRGEGLIGLAHAFFRAGARAVVGSLWPQRDDEAAALMGEMASRLGSGRRVAGALAGAQRAMLGRGAPASAWAGFVVMGDGDAVPIPERPGDILRRGPVAWAGLVLVLIATVLIARRLARGA